MAVIHTLDINTVLLEIDTNIVGEIFQIGKDISELLDFTCVGKYNLHSLNGFGYIILLKDLSLNQFF